MEVVGKRQQVNRMPWFMMKVNQLVKQKKNINIQYRPVKLEQILKRGKRRNKINPLGISQQKYGERATCIEVKTNKLILKIHKRKRKY